ncbi:hypothetical protein CPB85DRAFT_1430816 [Mucidula mucida]|nr:hypothetical protein CPB85DRAFT_1430816 [Mucidula mucida]
MSSSPALSRSSSPVQDTDEFMACMAEAMQSSPVRLQGILGKRPAEGDEERDELDEEGDTDSRNTMNSSGNGVVPGLSFRPNPNDVNTVRQFASRKRLKPEQITEVEVFLQEPPLVREGKMFATLLATFNKADEIVLSTPPFQVSAELKKNMDHYATAFLLSTHISTYKGASNKASFMKILNTVPIDIPAKILAAPANRTKMETAAGNALTQARGAFKKALVASAKASPQMDIITLAREFIKNTKCEISVPLCCRIALMRKVFQSHPGNKFWDKLNMELSKIKKLAKGDARALVRAFQFLYEEDKRTYGSGTVESSPIKDTVDAFQQQVDDLIRTGELDLATTNASSSSSGATGSVGGANGGGGMDG